MPTYQQLIDEMTKNATCAVGVASGKAQVPVGDLDALTRAGLATMTIEQLTERQM